MGSIRLGDCYCVIILQTTKLWAIQLVYHLILLIFPCYCSLTLSSIQWRSQIIHQERSIYKNMMSYNRKEEEENNEIDKFLFILKKKFGWFINWSPTHPLFADSDWMKIKFNQSIFTRIQHLLFFKKEPCAPSF